MSGKLNAFFGELTAFDEFGKSTWRDQVATSAGLIPVFLNQFWTSKQRDAHSLHEISYRACYKPQLPAFFISRLTTPRDLVYDPFLGRGTTMLEAALLGRRASGNDANPLSRALTRPRLRPPPLNAVLQRLRDFRAPPKDRRTALESGPEGLDAFFETETLAELLAWRRHFNEQRKRGGLDEVDDWIQMVMVSRLTGHSTGFFSAYTLPPNQAVSVARQRKINAKRNQIPPYRDVRSIVATKSVSLLRNPLPRGYGKGKSAQSADSISHESAEHNSGLKSASVQLIVTSPPFLNIVQYRNDNWLRNWFINESAGALWEIASLDSWLKKMEAVFTELRRVLKPGGIVAFEVGEVRKGSLPLDQELLAVAVRAGLQPAAILVNAQNFTKTANVWGIANNAGGTNTNRILLLRRSGR